MRILVETHHPAHVHFFKHAVRIWRERGDEVLVIGRDRDVMRKLLDAYDWMPSVLLTTAGQNNRFPMVEMLRRQLGVGQRIARFRPDVVVSLMGSYTQSAFAFRVPNVIFTDSEFQHFNHRIAHPFATRIYTPACFWKALGPKQIRYDGYHELAFLHPTRFTPDPAVLTEIGAKEGQYVVLRMSAWNTLHDIGEAGLAQHFDRYMTELGARAPVYVVPEGGRLPARWESHRLRIRPEQFHDVLAFARLVVTEGASTASEAACLGVPSVFINSTSRGYLDDQERRYGLVSNFRQPGPALKRALALLDAPKPAKELTRARQQLLDDHIDVTGFVVEAVDDTVPRAAG